MRGTIHLVTADDALTLRPLTQVVLTRAFNGQAFARNLAGLDLAEVTATGRALCEERPRTRADLGRLLAERWPGYDKESLGVRDHLPGRPRPGAAARPVGPDRPDRLDPGRRPGSALTSAGTPKLDQADAPLPGRLRPGHRRRPPDLVRPDRLREVADRLRPQPAHLPHRAGTELLDLPDAAAAGRGHAGAAEVPARVRQRAVLATPTGRG